MNKLQSFLRRMMRFSIPNLMTWVVGGQALLYVLSLMGMPVYSWFSLSRFGLLHGQLWRLVTFIFVPQGGGLLATVIGLYFTWLVGNMLQNRWGSGRFTCYYLFGMAGAILACLLTGYGTNTYLNLSLFLAFAAVYPELQILLFYVLPIKAKYLGLAALLYLLWQLLTAPWWMKIALLLALLNVILFVGGDMLNTLRRESGYWKTRYNFRRAMRR